MEKFKILYTILSDLQDAGVLKHFVLVGSWCQEFYRLEYKEAFDIPATRTNDADILIPRHFKIKESINLFELFKKRGFVPQAHNELGFIKLIHRDLTFEFLTDSSSKAETSIKEFKSINISAQELRFMDIPISYKKRIIYKDITLYIPEPEAFALHKLIVSQRRQQLAKRDKDIETVKGMFLFFEGKKKHIIRLHQILNELPKGWQKKINQALKKTELVLPK